MEDEKINLLVSEDDLIPEDGNYKDNIEEQYTEELDFSNLQEEIEKAKMATPNYNDSVTVPVEPLYEIEQPENDTTIQTEVTSVPLEYAYQNDNVAPVQPLYDVEQPENDTIIQPVVNSVPLEYGYQNDDVTVQPFYGAEQPEINSSIDPVVNSVPIDSSSNETVSTEPSYNFEEPQQVKPFGNDEYQPVTPEPVQFEEDNQEINEHPSAKIVLNKGEEEEEQEVIRTQDVKESITGNKTLLYVLGLGLLLLAVTFLLPYLI